MAKYINKPMSLSTKLSLPMPFEGFYYKSKFAPF